MTHGDGFQRHERQERCAGVSRWRRARDRGELINAPKRGRKAAEWVVIGAAPIAGLALAQLVPAKPTITRALTSVASPFITPNGGGMMLAQAL
jgi:hypothetical protein